VGGGAEAEEAPLPCFAAGGAHDCVENGSEPLLLSPRRSGIPNSGSDGACATGPAAPVP